MAVYRERGSLATCSQSPPSKSFLISPAHIPTYIDQGQRLRKPLHSPTFTQPRRGLELTKSRQQQQNLSHTICLRPSPGSARIRIAPARLPARSSRFGGSARCLHPSPPPAICGAGLTQPSYPAGLVQFPAQPPPPCILLRPPPFKVAAALSFLCSSSSFLNAPPCCPYTYAWAFYSPLEPAPPSPRRCWLIPYRIPCPHCQAVGSLSPGLAAHTGVRRRGALGFPQPGRGGVF